MATNNNINSNTPSNIQMPEQMQSNITWIGDKSKCGINKDKTNKNARQ